jgi:hypothetical protein
MAEQPYGRHQEMCGWIAHALASPKQHCESRHYSLRVQSSLSRTEGTETLEKYAGLGRVNLVCVATECSLLNHLDTASASQKREYRASNVSSPPSHRQCLQQCDAINEWIG